MEFNVERFLIKKKIGRMCFDSDRKIYISIPDRITIVFISGDEAIKIVFDYRLIKIYKNIRNDEKKNIKLI